MKLTTEVVEGEVSSQPVQTIINGYKQNSVELLSKMHIAFLNKMLTEERLLDMNIEKLEIVAILITRVNNLCIKESILLSITSVETRSIKL